MKDAVTYFVYKREYLCAILQHGEIEISNNQVENAIRPIVVGWKNRLFSDTPTARKPEQRSTPSWKRRKSTD